MTRYGTKAHSTYTLSIKLTSNLAHSQLNKKARNQSVGVLEQDDDYQLQEGFKQDAKTDGQKPFK